MKPIDSKKALYNAMKKDDITPVILFGAQFTEDGTQMYHLENPGIKYGDSLMEETIFAMKTYIKRYEKKQ